ncbi:YdeI/OmpD-associated family protein [Synechocystis salina]|uniref:YdeI/OmpD-associated family protein n=1 Tax=Synechocystis salina LEGE 00031 TaxID=1828736 RepID=A0ABR9VR91_9SYNC|nr:YdeI/OmpD-associated family protein [Synechocystis salina]MBE9242845.1 YdeI/OmpD-associated family protein [Synechocystis salina LEGE 00041]MBE9253832.1 YdeI/OmpD-associated family protein [Synechocystis salina LEGE 00031]
MEVTKTYKAINRTVWRSWLEQNHATTSEIWLLFDELPDCPTVSYLDAVEEAICFDWIDGIEKRFSTHERAQRFTPRKKRSNWTELNKERARRLIRLGMMTNAGFATLPDLTIKFEVPKDIVEVMKTESDAWSNFLAFPDLYRRIRIGYIEEMRKNPREFERRLQNFVSKTARNQMFGNWNDKGRLI